MIDHCVAEPEIALPGPTFDRKGIAIYECPSCGSFMADAGYEVDQYDDNYYTLASADLNDIEKRWGFRWRYVLDRIVAEKGREATVLDVGAGNGYFVKVARDEYGLAATGIEISADSAAFARTVLDVDLEVIDLREVTDRFDVVTAFSVIEHVEDPVAMLQELASRLADDGLLVLATPNPGCIQRRVKGKRRWGQINPPHHLNIMSPSALDRLLSDAGFEVVRQEAVSTSVKAVRKFDTEGEHLRRAIFQALRLTRLGADQLVFARRVAA